MSSSAVSSAVRSVKPWFGSQVITPSEFLQSFLEYAIHHGDTQTQQRGKIVPLCAAWFLPNDPEKRSGRRVFEAARIPNSRFFDLDLVRDCQSPYPHMLPHVDLFNKEMGRLGIRPNSTVVVYDAKETGLFSAPRLAWTLKTLGHDKVHVLNNFKTYVEKGFPLESGPRTDKKLRSRTAYRDAKEPRDSQAVASFEYMKELATSHGTGSTPRTTVLDARPKGRFDGKDPEPREGLSSGHMPGSISLPFTELLHPETKQLLPAEDLKAIFEAKGITPDDSIVSTCGTGVTAAIIDLALAEAGYSPESRRLYDGSWTEWAQRVTPGEGLILKNDT